MTYVGQEELDLISIPKKGGKDIYSCITCPCSIPTKEINTLKKKKQSKNQAPPLTSSHDAISTDVLGQNMNT